MAGFAEDVAVFWAGLALKTGVAWDQADFAAWADDTCRNGEGARQCLWGAEGRVTVDEGMLVAGKLLRLLLVE